MQEDGTFRCNQSLLLLWYKLYREAEGSFLVPLSERRWLRFDAESRPSLLVSTYKGLLSPGGPVCPHQACHPSALMVPRDATLNACRSGPHVLLEWVGCAIFKLERISKDNSLWPFQDGHTDSGNSSVSGTAEYPVCCAGKCAALFWLRE